MNRRGVSCSVALAFLAFACNGAVTGDASVPPATAYDRPVAFEGEWYGEIGSTAGTLTVERLGELDYYGRFRADDETVQYVLAMEQSSVVAAGGGATPANRVVFTWQDGRGERGHGWLLINREDTTLTGEHGHGERWRGAGEWTFIRAM